MNDTDRNSGAHRPQVTGMVTCLNEERNIGACIESMDWCDEILVVDSFSTDRTEEIARSYEKVRFLQRKYFGGASQKNWAIEQARYPWVFCLDADETCTPELQAEIATLLAAGPDADAYWIRRRSHVMGKVLRYSGWQNDRVIRLFLKGRAYYRNRRVHEEMLTVGTTPVLRNPMDHDLLDELYPYLMKISRYGYWGAAQLWRDGRRSQFSHVLVRPLWRFLRTYFLQLGFLDGTRGLIFCSVQAYATYAKWALLWSWQNGSRGSDYVPELPEFDEDDAVWDGLHRLEAEIRNRTAQPEASR